MKSVQIGILGFGTVGSGVVKLIQENRALLQQRLGGQVVIRRIADTDVHRRRNVEVDPTLLTTDATAVLEDPAIDIIVELIGGCDVALRFCREALNRNKHLVTANKALLATHGLELYRTAATHRVSIGFEASVCGGIPLIRAMKEGLVADRVRSIMERFLNLEQRSRVLDLGCGAGRRTLELARRGHRVLGVDPDEKLLAQARA